VTNSGTWSRSDVQDEAARRVGVEPPPVPLPGEPGTPAPPIGEDDKSMIVAIDSNGTAWIGDGMTRYPPTENDFNVKVLLGKDDCFRFVNTQGERVSNWNNVHTVDDNVIEALGRWSG
jgi:hypothetical protein